MDFGYAMGFQRRSWERVDIQEGEKTMIVWQLSDLQDSDDPKQQWAAGEIERLTQERDAARIDRDELRKVRDIWFEEAERLYADLDAANNRFHRMNSPTGREIELQAELQRLQAIVRELHRTCGMEMSDGDQGPSETCCKMWDRIEEAAEKVR
jgi:hypothetical protein